jgi:hypothetical protein
MGLGFRQEDVGLGCGVQWLKAGGCKVKVYGFRV